MIPFILRKDEYEASKDQVVDSQLFPDFLALNAELIIKADTVKADNERSRLTIRGGRKGIKTIFISPIGWDNLRKLLLTANPGVFKTLIEWLLGIGLNSPLPIRLQPSERARNHIPKLTKGTGGNLISISGAKPSIDVTATIRKDSDASTIVTGTITIDANGDGESKLVIPAAETETKGELEILQEVLPAADPDNATGVAINHDDKQTLNIL